MGLPAAPRSWRTRGQDLSGLSLRRTGAGPSEAEMPMAAKYVLAALSAVFLVMGSVRAGLSSSQSRTWLLVGVIFGAVSAWLWYRG